MTMESAGERTNQDALIICNGMGGQSLPEENAENVTAPPAKVGFTFGLKGRRGSRTDREVCTIWICDAELYLLSTYM